MPNGRLYNPPRRVASPFDLLSSDGYRLRLAHNTSEELAILATTPPPGACSDALAGGGAGNVDNGVHSYKITFVTAAGETEAGTASDGVTVADKTVDGKVALTAIPVSPNPQVTSRKIYRTAAGGSSYLLLDTIADNTTTTYTDNIADSSLTTAAPSANTALDQVYTFDPAGGSYKTLGAYVTLGSRFYRSTMIFRNGIPSVAPTLDVIHYSPLYVPETRVVDRIACSVMTGVATSKIRLGIYRSGGVTSPLPRNLVVDSGEIDAAATAEKIVTISTTLIPGLYWLAFLMGTAAATVGAYNGNYDGVTPPIVGSAATGVTSDAGNLVSEAFAYAALPALATPVISITSANFPAVAVRFSA